MQCCVFIDLVFITFIFPCSQPNGKDIPVTSENVDEYVQETLEAMLGVGVRDQVQAFRQGFSKVFLVTDMHMFTVEELAMLFGNAEEDWSADSTSNFCPLPLRMRWLGLSHSCVFCSFERVHQGGSWIQHG